MNLLREIELFCRSNDMTTTAFGRAAMNDPRFVFDLRSGRDLRSKTLKRVQNFMRGTSS